MRGRSSSQSSSRYSLNRAGRVWPPYNQNGTLPDAQAGHLSVRPETPPTHSPRYSRAALCTLVGPHSDISEAASKSKPSATLLSTVVTRGERVTSVNLSSLPFSKPDLHKVAQPVFSQQTWRWTQQGLCHSRKDIFVPTLLTQVSKSRVASCQASAANYVP